MADEKFSDNILRMIAAELHFASTMNVAREMFGKSYFALGVGERQTVDQTVVRTIAASHQALTAQFLASQVVQQPVGSRAHEQKEP